VTLIWISLALADAGSRTCVMRSLPVRIAWTESGDVTVKDGSAVLVSVNVGALVGTTSVRCKGDSLEFLTDTHRIPGKITLEKVKVGLGEIFDTLDPKRFEEAKVAARPHTPRHRNRRPAAPPPAPVPTRPVGVAAAEACVNTKAWDDYDQGWRVRSITAELMDATEGRNLAVSLLEGNEYRFFGCAQSSVGDLQLRVFGEDGRAVAVDSSHDRQPQVDFRPAVSGTYHVVLTAPDEDGKLGAALGVVYR